MSSEQRRRSLRRSLNERTLQSMIVEPSLTAPSGGLKRRSTHSNVMPVETPETELQTRKRSRVEVAMGSSSGGAGGYSSLTTRRRRSIRLSKGYDQLMETPGMSTRTAIEKFLQHASEESPLEAVEGSLHRGPSTLPQRESLGHYRLKGYDQLMETPGMTPRTAIQNFLKHAPEVSPLEAGNQSLPHRPYIPPVRDSLELRRLERLMETPGMTPRAAIQNFLQHAPEESPFQAEEQHELNLQQGPSIPPQKKTLVPNTPLNVTVTASETSRHLRRSPRSSQTQHTKRADVSDLGSIAEGEDIEKELDVEPIDKSVIIPETQQQEQEQNSSTGHIVSPSKEIDTAVPNTQESSFSDRHRGSHTPGSYVSNRSTRRTSTKKGHLQEGEAGIDSLTSGSIQTKLHRLGRSGEEISVLASNTDEDVRETNIGLDRTRQQDLSRTTSQHRMVDSSADGVDEESAGYVDSGELQDGAEAVQDVRRHPGRISACEEIEISSSRENEGNDNEPNDDMEDAGDQDEVTNNRTVDTGNDAPMETDLNDGEVSDHRVEESLGGTGMVGGGRLRGEEEEEEDSDGESEHSGHGGSDGRRSKDTGPGPAGEPGDIDESDAEETGDEEDTGGDPEDGGEDAEETANNVENDADCGPAKHVDLAEDDIEDTDDDDESNAEETGDEEDTGGDPEDAEETADNVEDDADRGPVKHVDHAEDDIEDTDDDDDDDGGELEKDGTGVEDVGNDIEDAGSDREGAGNEDEGGAGGDMEDVVGDKLSTGLPKENVRRKADHSAGGDSPGVLEDISSVAHANAEDEEEDEDNEDVNSPSQSARLTYVPVKTPHMPPATKPALTKTPQRRGPSATSTPVSGERPATSSRGLAELKQNQQTKKRPAKKPSKKLTRKEGPVRFPASLTKSFFSHFSKSGTVSKEVLAEVEKVSDKFWKNLVDDLGAFAGHAHRKTVTEADVEILMRRQGFVTEKCSLYTLVDQYLPLEYRQEIIPVARSGNVVVPRL